MFEHEESSDGTRMIKTMTLILPRSSQIFQVEEISYKLWSNFVGVYRFKYVVSKKEKKKERSKNIFETFEKVWQSKKEQSIFLEISSMNNNIPIP